MKKIASMRSILRPGWNWIRTYSRFLGGYRHLAYLRTHIGYDVKVDMPGLKGPEVEALYARGATWLRGGSPD